MHPGDKKVIESAVVEETGEVVTLKGEKKFFTIFGGRRFFGVLLFAVLYGLKAFGVMPADNEDMWVLAAVVSSFILGESGKDIVAQVRALKMFQSVEPVKSPEVEQPNG